MKSREPYNLQILDQIALHGRVDHEGQKNNADLLRRRRHRLEPIDERDFAEQSRIFRAEEKGDEDEQDQGKGEAEDAHDFLPMLKAAGASQSASRRMTRVQRIVAMTQKPTKRNHEKRSPFWSPGLEMKPFRSEMRISNIQFPPGLWGGFSAAPPSMDQPAGRLDETGICCVIWNAS
jgi:hypothetical protein